MSRVIILFLSIGCVSSVMGQSLWNPTQPAQSLFADTIARGVGDVLTIVIAESQRVQNREQTQLEKEATLDASLTSFALLPNAFNVLPGVNGSSDRNLQAEARYDKTGSFDSRISVVVIDVLPNGNLLIEGRRRVVMDREQKTIRIAGIVRPYDIKSDNTIVSTSVANASVAYEGDGPLTATTNRGWLSDLLDFVWPF